MYKSYCYVKLFPPWSWRNLNYSYMQGYEICYFCFLKQLKMWILFILDNGELKMIETKFIIMQHWTPIVIYIAKENYNKVAVYLIYSIESLAVEIKLRSLHTQSPLKKCFLVESYMLVSEENCYKGHLSYLSCSTSILNKLK